MLVNEGGSLHEETFIFQSAIHPEYGDIQWESRNDDKSWLVPLPNIHDPGTLELGTRMLPLTRRFSDTEHSTGVTNTIDYRNDFPNYQEWEVEPELNRTHYEQLMDTLDNANRRSIRENNVHNLGEVEITYENVEDEEKCGICLELFEESEMCKKIQCQHLFHIPCLSHWLINNDASKYPYCRTNIFEELET